MKPPLVAMWPAHRDDGIVHLLGPRVHDLCHSEAGGQRTDLLQSPPQILGLGVVVLVLLQVVTQADLELILPQHLLEHPDEWRALGTQMTNGILIPIFKLNVVTWKLLFAYEQFNWDWYIVKVIMLVIIGMKTLTDIHIGKAKRTTLFLRLSDQKWPWPYICFQHYLKITPENTNLFNYVVYFMTLLTD